LKTYNPANIRAFFGSGENAIEIKSISGEDWKVDEMPNEEAIQRPSQSPRARKLRHATSRVAALGKAIEDTRLQVERLKERLEGLVEEQIARAAGMEKSITDTEKHLEGMENQLEIAKAELETLEGGD